MLSVVSFPERRWRPQVYQWLRERLESPGLLCLDWDETCAAGDIGEALLQFLDKDGGALQRYSAALAQGRAEEAYVEACFVLEGFGVEEAQRQCRAAVACRVPGSCGCPVAGCRRAAPSHDCRERCCVSGLPECGRTDGRSDLDHDRDHGRHSGLHPGLGHCLAGHDDYCRCRCRCHSHDHGRLAWREPVRLGLRPAGRQSGGSLDVYAWSGLCKYLSHSFEYRKH